MQRSKRRRNRVDESNDPMLEKRKTTDKSQKVVSEREIYKKGEK